MICDASVPRYTWGLLYRKGNKVAMFNMTKEEAERLERTYPDIFVARPISTNKCRPGLREIKGTKIHGI